MDVNLVLQNLITQYQSLPVIKLVWECQIGLSLVELPKLTPSHYIKEARLTTAERYDLLLRQHKKLEFWTPDSELTVVPSIIAFQGYRAGDQQCVTISIRNISKNMQKVNLLMDESGPFSIDGNSTRVAQFPSGMSFTATVCFKPEDDEFYYHKLVLVTRTSRFVIPIIGMGGRGILDLPDLIDFGSVSVKSVKTLTTPFCNVGTNVARFTMTTDGPFSVSPEKGVVLPNDAFNLVITFTSEFCLKAAGTLKIRYESGEEVYVALAAEAVNERITLTPSDVEFVDTYIGLKTKVLVTIQNDSDTKATFRWKKYISLTASTHDNIHALQLQHVHHHGGGGDTGRSNEKHPHHHLYSRGDSIGDSKLVPGHGPDGFLKDSEPLYFDDTFAIEPPMGEVHPHTSTDVYIFFNPKRTGMYISEAFCDITGLEDRSEMRMSGRGMGPKFKFQFAGLDIGTLYLGGGHTYEIPVTNISDIEGICMFDSVTGMMPEAKVRVEPTQLSIAPGAYNAFFMYFNCSGKPGKFHEELRFKVPSTEEIMCLDVKGEILHPAMHFSVDTLFLGDVSYGFPTTTQVIIVNDSLNHVDVVLSLDVDGADPALTAEEIVALFAEDNVDFPENPKEFTLDPVEFQLTPRGFQRINVTLCSGNFGDYKRTLLVSALDKEVISRLPIVGRCMPPTLIKSLDPIVLRDCYTQFPYPATLKVHNPSDMYGIYCCIPKHSVRLRFESEVFVGIIKPKETTEIPLTVTCVDIGEIHGHVELYLIGKDDPLMNYLCKCFVISSQFLEVNTQNIHIPDLHIRDTGKESFEISNRSPLSIPFTIFMIQGELMGDVWTTSPAEGTLLPNSTITVVVKVVLQEAGARVGIVRIQTNAGLTYVDVKIKVKGIGCNLGICPPLDRSGRIDFGSLFIKTAKSFTYEVTNRGHLDKFMEWRHEKDDPPKNAAPEAPKMVPRKDLSKKGAVEKAKPVVKKPMKTVFDIHPVSKVIRPGEKMEVIIKTNAPTPMAADETYILWAYTPRKPVEVDTVKWRPGKEVAKPEKKSEDLEVNHQAYVPVAARRVRLTGLFELPALAFSKKEYLFKIEASPTQDDFQQKSEGHIENKCSLPLTASFSTSAPFSIIVKGLTPADGVQELTHSFGPGESITLTINFDGSHERKDVDKGILVFEKTLKVLYGESGGREVIPLKGEVHFPCVEIDREFIDFGVVINGTEAIQEILVTNTCQYCLSYKLYIKPNSTVISHVKARSSAKKKGLQQLETTGSIMSEAFKQDKPKTKSKGKKYKPPGENPNPAKEAKKKRKAKTPKAKVPKQSFDLVIPDQHDEERPKSPVSEGSEPEDLKDFLGENYSSLSVALNLNQQADMVQFLREKMYRAKMMEMMGLHDPDREIDDELTYLQCYHVHAQTVNHASPSELVDVVPNAGIIQAGQSQRFTAVFYGKSDISLKSVIVFFIEGGQARYLTVTGHSTPALVPITPKRKSYDSRIHDDCHSKHLGMDVDVHMLGACAHKAKNSYKFTTHVRKPVTRLVPVTNKTHKREVVNPSFVGHYFSGEEVISIPPKTTVDYMITYLPLEMTRTCKSKHTGSVYFVLSCGAVTLYNFIGLALPPEPAGKLFHVVKSRSPWTEKLAVKNWLDTPQTFHVKNEILNQVVAGVQPTKTGSKPDLHDFLFLVGHDHIDVEANETENYVLHFLAYREGLYDYRVMFTNKAREFVYYDLSFRVTKPDILDTIHLSTLVREKIVHDIVVDNPLQIEAVVRASTAVPYIRVVPRKATIQPKTEYTMKLECFPLLPGKYEGAVDIASPELGLYPYSVVIEVGECPPEDPTYFSAELSHSFQQYIRITNYSSSKTDFNIELKSPDFFIKEDIITIEKRTQTKVLVYYEPRSIGVQSATLLAISNIGGKFEFPLFGTSTAPIPQGSFILKENVNATIVFKNPLANKANFQIQVDPPFSLVGIPKTSELRPQQELSIVVELQMHPPPPTTAKSKKRGAQSQKKTENEKPFELTDLPPLVVIEEFWEDFVVGQLSVTCHSVPGAGGNGKDGDVRWLYYLQGILSDKLKSQKPPPPPPPSSATSLTKQNRSLTKQSPSQTKESPSLTSVPPLKVSKKNGKEKHKHKGKHRHKEAEDLGEHEHEEEHGGEDEDEGTKNLKVQKSETKVNRSSEKKRKQSLPQAQAQKSEPKVTTSSEKKRNQSLAEAHTSEPKVNTSSEKKQKQSLTEAPKSDPKVTTSSDKKQKQSLPEAQ